MHTILLSRNTNKLQLRNRIYYSKVYWRLNMFRAAHPSSPVALNSICSLWFICPYGDRPLPLSAHSALATAGHHMGVKPRGCKYSLELLMMSGVPLETCWTFNKVWNNKFYYKTASCWYFYWVLLMYIFQMAVSKNKTLNFPGSEGIIIFFGTIHSVQLSNLHESVPRHILPPDIIMCHYCTLI